MDLGDKDDMRDYDRIHRFIESTYKNILKNFNPGVKQIIVLGKALQKTKQNVGAAFKAYNECLYELAKMAETCKGATKDLGTGLIELTDSQSEINQQLIDGVKIFHKEFLIPLKAKQETEFKQTQELLDKYLSGHKQHVNNLRKAQTILERYKKKHKSKPSGQKEMEKARRMRDCKKKLEDHLKTNLRQALVEERKRYCYLFNRLLYVVEDQVKKYSRAMELFMGGLESWPELCKRSHSLPRSSEQFLQEFGLSDESGDLEEDRSGEEYHSALSVGTTLSLNRRDLVPKASHGGQTWSRVADQVKPETSSTGPGRGTDSTPEDVMRRFSAPSSTAAPVLKGAPPEATGSAGPPEVAGLAPPEVEGLAASMSPPAVLCAVYPYVAATEVQLSLEANDVVRVFGEAYNGWVYGKNIRTNREGWFPLSFTDFNEDLLHWKASLLSRYQLLTHARNASLTNLRSAWHSELDYDLGRRHHRRPSRCSEADAADLSTAMAATGAAASVAVGEGAAGVTATAEEDVEESVAARTRNRRAIPLEPISEQIPPPEEFRDRSTSIQVQLQLTKVATVVSSSENSEQDDPVLAAEGGVRKGGEREETEVPVSSAEEAAGGGSTFGEEASTAGARKEEARKVMLVESGAEDGGGGGGGGGGKGGWLTGPGSSRPSFLNAKLSSPPPVLPRSSSPPGPVAEAARRPVRPQSGGAAGVGPSSPGGDHAPAEQRPRSSNAEVQKHVELPEEQEEEEEEKKGVVMETSPSPPSSSSVPGRQPPPPPDPPPPLPLESYQPRNDYFVKAKLRKADSDDGMKAY